MKKIAIVAPMSYRGGTELSLIQLLRLIPEKQYDITLLIIGDHCDLENEIPEWIKTHTVSSDDCWTSIKKSLFRADFFSAINTFWKTLRRTMYRKLYRKRKLSQYSMLMGRYEKLEDEYDLAIAWAWPSSIENVYTLENVKAKRKAMWVHTDVTKDKPPADAGAFYVKFDDIFCVSAACKEKFDEAFPQCRKRTKVYYNIIDAGEIKEAAKESVQLDENVFKIMTCGRLSSEKQPMMAIKVVKKMLDNGFHDFKWYFIGGGGNAEIELQEAVHKEHLEDYVILLGFQENPYSYVSKADLYAQMSLHESFCLALAEAQLLGIPAISTNFPSAYEIVDDGRTGYIVNNDAEDVFTAIKKVIADKNILEKMRNELAKNCTVPVGDPLQLVRYVENEV